MRWNPFQFKRKPSQRRPIRKTPRLGVEELESRFAPSVNVLTYHNDAASTGQNLNETALTPANVTPTTFGKLFTTSVDGQVYAQPLLDTGVTITTGANAGSHDVVFAATEHNSLYAIDAHSGTVLWKDALLTAEHGGTVTTVPSADVGTNDITPEIGITATPVIDPTTNTIYVAAKSKEVASDGTHYEQHLYAINIQNGAITRAVLIADSIGDTVVSGPSVAGTGDGTQNGVVRFDALRELNRVAVTLVNGNVYLAFASHGDNGPYHGWILGYSTASLALTAAFNVNPNGSDDGIWQSGGSLASETVNGNTYLYFETGNGTFDTTLTPSPYNANLMVPSQGDYGDSFVKVQIDGSTPAAGSLNATNNINGWGMHVADYFTPSNQGNLSDGDTDLGSGGPLLLPASAGSAAHPNLLVGSGKEGRIYLIDRNNMGGYHGDAAGDGASGFDNVVQETTTGAVNGALDTPAYYNGLLYYVGGYGDVARTFSIVNGVLSSTSTTQSSDSYGFPGSTPSISANGSTNAIVWDIAGPGTNQLRAYDASQGYNKEIYTSAQAANNRDALGTAVKFTVPTVANGEVFVGTANSLVAYGLLQQASTTPAAPTNLIANAFSGSIINLNWTDNDVAPNTATGYNIEESTDGSHFSVVGTASAGATTFSIGGLQVSTLYDFRIDAFNAQGTSAYSNPASATTTSQVNALDFSAGFAGSAGALTFNGKAKLNGIRAELTDGGFNEAGSVFSTNAVDVTKFSTQFTFQETSASADGFTFTIQGNGPTALGPAGGGLGYGPDQVGGTGGIPNSLAIKFDIYSNAGEGTDSTGEYTDGASPTIPSIDLTSSGLQLKSGDVIQVVMTYDGTTLNVTISDASTGKTASQSYTVNIPQVIGRSTGYVGFTGGTGGLSAVQDILTWSYSPNATSPPAAPSALTGADISASEVDLTWTDNSSNETGFLIDRSTDNSTFTQIASVGANVVAYADTTLSPNQTYYYKVQASNSAGTSAFSNTFQITTPVSPAPPSNLHATLISTTEVDLAWTNNATNATGYKVLMQLQSNAFKVIVTGLSPTTTSYNITGLTPGTNYHFEVDALNSAGPSSSAAIGMDTVPAAPTGLSATGGSGQVHLSWTANPGAVAYNLYRGTSPAGEGATPYATSIAGTSFTDTSVTAGTTYYYRLTAVDANSASPVNPAGESAESSEVSATPQALSGGLNFAGGFANAKGLTLNGSATLNGANLQLTSTSASQAGSAYFSTPQTITSFTTQFTFQLSAGANTADGFTFVIQNSGLTALGLAGGGLGYGPDHASGTPGIGKSLAIKFDLYSNEGEGNDSTGLFTNGAAPTVAGSLSLVGAVDLHSGDVMQVTLSYDGSNLTETVKDTTTGGTFTHTYSNVNIASIVGGSTAYVGFTAGTGGLTALQNIKTWTFTPGNPLGAPTNLAAVPQNGPQVQLTWNDNSSIETGFTITRATDSGFTQNVTTLNAPANATATATYVDTTVAANTTYWYRVQAVNGASSSAFSNAVTAFIPAAPATPSNGHATLITTTEVDLAWTNNATNADVYKIFREVVGGSFVLIAALPGNSTSYKDTGLTPGTNYDYHIEAWNIAGANDRTGANLYTVSPAITNLSAAPSSGQVALSWTAPAGGPVLTYNVYRGTSAGGEGATPIATGLTSPAFTDTNVTNGTAYYYQVTSVNPQSLSTPSVAPNGESAKSNEASATPQAVSGGIHFANGFANATGLTLNGSATLNGSKLQLTNTSGNQAGSAYFSTPQTITTFTTQFTFQLSAGANTADGFTFVIQNSGLTALGPNGGGLGYGPDHASGTPGIGKSVAIKFDLYSNEGEGNDSTGLYIDGAAPTAAGSLSMVGSVDLHSGDVMQVTLSYDGSNLIETVKDTTTGGTFTHTYSNVNIASIVGGSTAYVGFTAGTGGLTALQNILTWTF